ncbi:hypothetical protein [Spirosoma rigui]|uniref:hypothetical protein n=1 Tax=Spirosoma rigui TaxID=564064 RepID=UPI0012D2BD16|nr:hypothetical protein [Spirosoma rigui]
MNRLSTHNYSFASSSELDTTSKMSNFTSHRVSVDAELSKTTKTEEAAAIIEKRMAHVLKKELEKAFPQLTKH